MFDSFQGHFPRDTWRDDRDMMPIASNDENLTEFFRVLGGASYKDGLYRTVHPADLSEWNARVSAAFPEFLGRITCFGYDWLGSIFALDSARQEEGRPGVVMFEPGTGEALEIPANLISFHEEGLMDFGEAALAISFYERWRAAGGSAPGHDECIGYRKPLFLGGADEVENLEASDIDVYWHIIGQLIAQTRGLPPGTPVHIAT